MFERFSAEASDVLRAAQGYSRRARTGDVGTEHLLLGLLDVPGSAAAAVVELLDVPLDDVRRPTEAALSERSGHASPRRMPFTTAAKQALELARRESIELEDEHVGTDHLLVGLARCHDGAAGQVLAAVGVDADRTHQLVLDARRRADLPTEHLRQADPHPPPPGGRRGSMRLGRLLVAAGPDDVPWAAGRVADALAQRYRLTDVAEWAATGATSDPFALLVVVGPTFLPLPADPDDAVRRGLAIAVARDVPVVVALIDDATMPTKAELPDDLAALADADHVTFLPDAFSEQVRRLVDRLKALLLAHEPPAAP
ncbi:MAG: Clp protease N-terminal domain-containing protein [Actinomycetota bacterium]|nr:Clp protease N-terminal domain-containing protein [Actinomycetota bacterium]